MPYQLCSLARICKAAVTLQTWPENREAHSCATSTTHGQPSQLRTTTVTTTEDNAEGCTRLSLLRTWSILSCFLFTFSPVLTILQGCPSTGGTRGGGHTGHRLEGPLTPTQPHRGQLCHSHVPCCRRRACQPCL